MDYTETSIGDYLAVIRRRKGQLFAIFGLLLLITLGVGFGLPPIYQSKATILIEQQEIPQDLVRSTVTSFADQRIQIISQRVMTSANLIDIIRKYDLYAKERQRKPMEIVIDEMRKDIELNTVSADVVNPANGQAQKATIAFTLAYENKSPELAQRVANELVSLYLAENLKSRSESAKGTSTFLFDEVQKQKQKVDGIDANLATFKEKHSNSLPEMLTFNLQSLEQARRDLLDAENKIKSDQERRIYLESQLAKTSPLNDLYSETGQRILSPSDRLKSLESNYITLKARYSPDYPDVVALKKQIDALKQHVNANESRNDLDLRLKGYQTDLVTAKKKYSEQHPDVKNLERLVADLKKQIAEMPPSTPAQKVENPDNPAYIQLKADLDANNNDLQALARRSDQFRDKIKQFEDRIAATPLVEKQYSELMRDEQVAQVQYNELLAKRMEAQVSQTMEAQRMGERFSLIEPPQLPEKPTKPNRPAILGFGAMLSFVLGLGGVAVSESFDATIRGRKAITKLLQVPPLAVIPVILTNRDRRRRKLNAILFLIAVIAGIAVAMVAVNYFYKPLDVIWATALNRLGIQGT